jgi:hypothetical protein
MQNIPELAYRTVLGCAAALLLTLATGCETAETRSAQPAPPKSTPVPAAPAAATPAPAPGVVTPTPAVAIATSPSIIRIKAGVSEPFKDSAGNVWKAEEGFQGGNVFGHENIEFANTKDAGLFLTEHYSMDSFSCPAANGKYIAKLYFSETFDGITGPGQRVFSFNVQGHEFKDFDVWVKAGGPHRAYIETVPVEITDGKFKITFTSNVENPQINAIELVPQP